ncbi:hypothetical protein [Trichothermofontia sp.]
MAIPLWQCFTHAERTIALPKSNTGNPGAPSQRRLFSDDATRRLSPTA